MKLPFRVLVVDDDENALSGIEELLRSAEHDVTTSSNYDEAKALLAEFNWDLFITDVRLRSYNGLHLVMKVRAESPDIAIVIMTGYDDSMMEYEARRYNAQFIRKPIRAAEFLEVVALSLNSVRRQRRWPRKQVAGGFRVTAAGRPASVLDVCYGGLRLEVPGADTLPPSFAVEVSGIGLNLEVEPVWSYPVEGRPGLLCGASLISDTTPAAHTWRTIVDRLGA